MVVAMQRMRAQISDLRKGKQRRGDQTCSWSRDYVMLIFHPCMRNSHTGLKGQTGPIVIGCIFVLPNIHSRHESAMLNIIYVNGNNFVLVSYGTVVCVKNV